MDIYYINLIARFLLGLVLAALAAVAAYQVHSLTPGGAIAAFVLGTVIFGLGGLPWAVLLLAFFLTSSTLSQVLHSRKQYLDEKFSKDSKRDAAQVFANGGVAGICTILHLIFPASALPWIAFAGSLAAVNADTWATELGVLSHSAPRLITSWKPVERGTSGAISLSGTLSALAGSALIAALALIFWQYSNHLPVVSAFVRLVIISLAGLVGSLVDSLLGATVQAIYYCPSCNKTTERHPLHTCGTQTTPVRGWSWMNNDWVNTFCAMAGALFALLIALL